MVQCAIKFENNPLGTFYSGSVVNGKVEILLEKPMDVQGISLIISGEAKVRWTETESRHTGVKNERRTETVTYSANENYMHTTTYLCGSPDGNATTINKGAHVYTFSCVLPPQLPSSVEGKYGKIRYSAKVVFNRPWIFNKTFTVGFTVLKITDLNYEQPAIRLPATLQVQKQFWCWPCASKPLIVEVTIPQSGYVPGQHIPVTVNLFNESGRTVQHIGVSLKKIMNCSSDFPRHSSKLESITVKKMVIGSIQNLPKEVMNVDLLVPSIPATCLGNTCRIIQVYYELRIKAFIQGPHMSPVITIPIIIGNIPIMNFNNNQPSGSSVTPSAPIGDAHSSNSPEISAAGFGLPPPTYEEAVYIERINMNEDEKYPIGDSNFLPRYPVFNFEASAPPFVPQNLETISEKF